MFSDFSFSKPPLPFYQWVVVINVYAFCWRWITKNHKSFKYIYILSSACIVFIHKEIIYCVVAYIFNYIHLSCHNSCAHIFTILQVCYVFSLPFSILIILFDNRYYKISMGKEFLLAARIEHRKNMLIILRDVVALFCDIVDFFCAKIAHRICMCNWDYTTTIYTCRIDHKRYIYIFLLNISVATNYCLVGLCEQSRVIGELQTNKK